MRKTCPPFLRAFSAVLLTVLLVTGCVPSSFADEPLSVTFDALEDPEFGAVSLGCSIEEFLQAGFAVGDSCDVILSNGFRMEDVPVYDGYYTLTGGALICLYPGYEHPAYTFSSTGDLWKHAGAQAGDTVTVTLKEPGKYAVIQNTMSATYSNDRNDFSSDTVFSNFRELSGGKLRPGMFFRGASPVDDRNLRAACTDGRVRENGIGFIIDLADTEEKAVSYSCFPGSAFEELMSAGQVVCLGLNSNYRSPDFAKKLAGGLRAMMSQDRPVYIHCTEGKDRTGFVCILLEALAGADYEEILNDYMITYDNYYGITETAAPDKYAATVRIRFRDMLDWLAGVPEGAGLSGQTFEKPAADYLIRAGMTETEIASLTRYLTQQR